MVPAIGRSDEARQHPAGRKVRVHARLTVGREGPFHQHVGDGCQASGAGTLQRSPDHHHGHARCRRRDHEASGEHRKASEVRPGGPESIGQLAGHDERDEVGQRVARQRDAVEGIAVQLVGDRRQCGEHGRDLERDHGHSEHQPDRQQSLLAVEPAWLAGGLSCHRGEPGATNGHGRARSTDNARSSSSSSLK